MAGVPISPAQQDFKLAKCVCVPQSSLYQMEVCVYCSYPVPSNQLVDSLSFSSQIIKTWGVTMNLMEKTGHIPESINIKLDSVTGWDFVFFTATPPPPQREG